MPHRFAKSLASLAAGFCSLLLLADCAEVTPPPAVPTVVSIVPSVGVRGTTTTVTVTGTNFTPGATSVTISDAGITVSDIVVSSSTQLTASVTIADDAALGDRIVAAQTPVGSITTSLVFTVRPAPPTLTGVSPAVGVQGTITPVTLTGSRFLSGATSVTVSGTGITATNIVVVSTTSLTADLGIAADAALGARTISVTTAGGTSGAQTLTINPPAPVLSGVNEPVGVQGGGVDVTLTGSHFVAGATTLAVSGTGVTVSQVNVASSTSITASISVAEDAPLGPRSITVTTAGGTSGPVTFTVNPRPPIITSVAPLTGVQGTTTSVTIQGARFIGNTTLAPDGTGVTVGNVVVTSATSLTADFTVDAAATLGAHGVTLSSAGGSRTFTFTVKPPPPTIVAVAPDGNFPGTSTAVTLTGTNFVPGATTLFVGGTGVTATDVTVTSSTTMTANFAIAADAAIASRTVSLQTAGGNSNTVGFFVRQPPPVLTSLSPAAGVQGTSTSVTIAGENFIAGATSVSISGTGVSAAVVTVTNSTSLTANFLVSHTATLGVRNVTVTTDGGTSGAQTFTVGPAATFPTITEVSPFAGVRGTTVSVTVTGTDFVPGATAVAVSGADVTVANVVVQSATSLTADVTIAADAALGSRFLSVTTAGGTTEEIFTVVPPAPTLTALSPATGNRSTNVSVTLTGTNFMAGETTVEVAGAGVVPADVQVASATSLTATFIVAPDADFGAHAVTVTTPGGTSAGQTFTVQSLAPTLAGVSPSSLVQGSWLEVTLTGERFAADLTGVQITGLENDLFITDLEVMSATTLRIVLFVDPAAEPGTRQVKVTTPNGVSSTVPLEITALQPPTLTAMSPTSTAQGTSRSYTLTGTSFPMFGSSVHTSSPKVSVTGINWVSPTEVSVALTVAADAPLGDYDITVVTPAGTTAAQTLTVVLAPPVLLQLQPSAFPAGMAVTVALIGGGFTADATVAVSGTGITLSDVTVAAGNPIMATFTIAHDAPIGARDVTVTTSAGTSAARPFTVLVPTPVISAVTPSVTRGTTTPVTIIGFGFYSGSAVSVSGTGISVTDVTVVSATSITANMVIDADAAVGVRQITVTNAGTGTSHRNFNVRPGAPTLASVTPAVAMRGAFLTDVVLTGTNFDENGMTASVSGTGVTVTNILATSLTTATAHLEVSPDAEPGERQLSVTTEGGTSSTIPFLVRLLAPTLFNVAPNTAPIGFESVTVTLSGTNFILGSVDGGTTVAVSGGGVTVSDVNVASASSLTAVITFGAGATAGSRDVTVTTGSGTSGPIAITAFHPAPTLTSVSPNVVGQGTVRTITLTGTRFVSGATNVAVSGSGITVDNVTFVSATQLTAQLTIAAGAATGARDVTVTTTNGGTSGAVALTVAAAPSIASSTPNSIARGAGSTPVTFSGTGFTGVNEVLVSGSLLTLTDFTVVNGTTATANVSTTLAAAAVGSYDIRFRNTLGSTSAPFQFSVTAVPPTIASVTPSLITLTGDPTIASVTITGTNFDITPSPTITIDGSGITVSDVTLVDATTMTATLTIAGSVASATRTITVSTGDGTASVPIEIHGSTGAVGFQYTGAAQTWIVPAGVTSVTVTAAGAQSGGTFGSEGGTATGTIAVTPGETLYLYVGGRGADGSISGSGEGTPVSGGAGGFNGGGNGGSGLQSLFNGGRGGGGGGGASDVRRGGNGLEHRAVIGGGGGGSSGGADAGGYGGGIQGTGAYQHGDFGGGHPGTATAGGAAGGFTSTPGTTAGTLGLGGNGGNTTVEYKGGGGGGGGYFGGGGGTGTQGRGGGGGSGFVAPGATNVSFTTGTRAGHGVITIVW